MSELELDPALLETLRTLQSHDVEFVLVGDVARAIHDDGGFVSGVAIVPAAYGRNVERLSNALHSMNGTLGIAGTPSAIDVDYRRADLRELAPCSFMTRGADVDVNFEPQGTAGYRDLFDDAAHVQLAPGVRPLVASQPDLERLQRGGAPSVPYATPPVALPPEPDVAAEGYPWPPAGEIRASRSTRA